jgi:rod shape-determining protein MreC
MTAILATRTARRRVAAYISLIAVTLLLMALSGAPLLVELQRGVGFAFRPIQGAVDTGAATVADAVAAISEIDHLRRDNEALRLETERLRNENARLEALRRENDQLTALLQLRSGLDHQTVTARVIARDSSEFRRQITLDRGTDDDLAVGDVVIAAGGALAGRVVDIGPTFARVQLVNDSASTVTGQLSGSAATGDVVGQLGGVLVMRDIDATREVVIGEEVFTAGLELGGGVRSPYPKGLLLGQVVDVQGDPNAVVQTAYLEAAADLDGLEHVLVIIDYEGGLIDPGEGEIPGEGPSGSPSPSGAATPSPALP